jgi:hypothetical protein
MDIFDHFLVTFIEIRPEDIIILSQIAQVTMTNMEKNFNSAESDHPTGHFQATALKLHHQQQSMFE